MLLIRTESAILCTLSFNEGGRWFVFVASWRPPGFLRGIDGAFIYVALWIPWKQDFCRWVIRGER